MRAGARKMYCNRFPSMMGINQYSLLWWEPKVAKIRPFQVPITVKKILKNIADSHPVSELRPDSLYEGIQNLRVPTNHNNEVGN